MNLLIMILEFVPAGIKITTDIINLIQAIDGHFNSPSPQSQQEVVKALAVHLKGAQ